MRPILRETWWIVHEAIKDWFEDKASAQGAALAFYSVLSLAPFVMISLAFIQLFVDKQTASTEFLRQVETMVGQDGAEAIAAMIDHGDRPAAGTFAAIVGIATLLFGATGVFVQLQDSMNMIWDAKPKQTSSWWSFLHARFLSLTMVMGAAFLILVSLLFSAAISGIGKYFVNRWPGMEILIHGAHEAISFVIISVLFAMMFKLLPDTHVAWRDVWFGAFVTSILFTIGKLLIGLYLGKSAVGSAYGAAGSLVVLVVWVYYSAQVLFLGAELAHTQAERRIKGSKEAARTAGNNRL
jgi:membrane protein